MKALAAVATLLLLGGLAQAQDVVEYYHLDAVGNVRAVSDQAGTLIERHDYLPYGEECVSGPCSANPGVGGGQARKFTGKERDGETGLDYFGARYYGSRIGRFTAVDPRMNVAGSVVSPQKWNRYAYGRNSPLSYVDPDGREDYRIVVGDPGIVGARSGRDHNVGKNFERVAGTRAEELRAAGHSVTVSRISTRAQFEAALTEGETINRGFIYIGHGGPGALAIGEQSDAVVGEPTNFFSEDILGLPRSTKLAAGASIELNSCFSACPLGTEPSLAEDLSIWLRRDTTGFTKGAKFAGEGPLDSRGRPPEKGPLRMVPDGGARQTFENLLNQ